MQPLVFLSHSGADTEAARELKRFLEPSPDARAAGLSVWHDKDALRPGTPYAAQIADSPVTLDRPICKTDPPPPDLPERRRRRRRSRHE